MSSFGIVIQARTGSTRMPGKVLQNINAGQNILNIIYEKLAVLDLPIVFAIPENTEDDNLNAFLLSQNYTVYRGSENNVLERMLQAGKQLEVDFIVRVCADNLFLHTPFIEELIKETKVSDDYISFYMNDDTPTILTHFGFFAEIVKLKTLEKVSTLTQETLYLEHVTNYIHQNPTHFQINKCMLSDKLNNLKDEIRLTIDTPQDFEIAKTIFNNLNNKNDLDEILAAVLDNEVYKKSMQKRIKKYTK